MPDRQECGAGCRIKAGTVRELARYRLYELRQIRSNPVIRMCLLPAPIGESLPRLQGDSSRCRQSQADCKVAGSEGQPRYLILVSRLWSCLCLGGDPSPSIRTAEPALSELYRPWIRHLSLLQTRQHRSAHLFRQLRWLYNVAGKSVSFTLN